MRVSLLSLVALAALPSGALAQSLTGAIGGSVKDPQVASVPGAGVSLVGRTRTLRTTTDRTGDYRFLAIEPGTYSVRVEVAGFKPQQRDTIAIHPGVLLTLDFLLSLGAVSDSIEVIPESPVVDVRNSEFRIGLTQDQLYNLPFARDSDGLRDALPGINGRSAFGAVPNGNALYLDGVDTRDPQNADFWLHVNYNLLQEVQVEGPGAPAEFGAYTGVVVNAITRSGGNSRSGLFDARYSWSSLASNNADAGIVAQNPGLGDPAVTTDLLDLTGQLGGPIRRDRLFFVLNGQHSVFDIDPSGPRTSEKRRDERWNGKLTWEPRPQDHVALSLQWDRHRELYIGQPTDTDAISHDSDRPEWIWGLQWRRTLGTQSFLDARYLGWTTTARQTPQAYVPAHLDVATGEKTGSWGVWSQTDQARHQVSLSLTHYAEAYGRHELKFGVEIERGKVRDQFGGAGQPPVYYIDYGGQPYLAYEYGFDATGYTRRQTAYAQDGWRATDRLTLNLGVRLDLYQGRNDTDAVWETHGLAPRLGLAWDVTGDHATVARASFARYYETLPVWNYFPALHGIEDFIVYNNTGSELVEIARLHKGDATVDAEIQHLRVDELALGIERAVGGDLRVSLTGIRRRTSNFFDALHEGAQYAPNTMTNPLTRSAPDRVRHLGPDRAQPARLHHQRRRAAVFRRRGRPHRERRGLPQLQGPDARGEPKAPRPLAGTGVVRAGQGRGHRGQRPVRRARPVRPGSVRLREQRARQRPGPDVERLPSRVQAAGLLADPSRRAGTQRLLPARERHDLHAHEPHRAHGRSSARAPGQPALAVAVRAGSPHREDDRRRPRPDRRLRRRHQRLQRQHHDERAVVRAERIGGGPRRGLRRAARDPPGPPGDPGRALVVLARRGSREAPAAVCGRPGHALRLQTTAGSSGVPDHFVRFSQPLSVTATVSSCRIPSSPGM